MRKAIGYTMFGICILISWPIHIILPILGLIYVVMTFIENGVIAGIISIFVAGAILWVLEIVIGLIALPIAGVAAALLERPELAEATTKRKPTRRRFPASLWLLPLFFGILGGIAAALVADLKYKASWWELFLGGIIISFLWFLLLAV